MAKKNFLDYEGLLHYNDKLKAIIDKKADGAEVNSKIAEINSQITGLSNGKVDKREGYGLSKNDFTDELKEKLENSTLDYEGLENIPTLDGTEIKGSLTKSGLGIASSTELSTVEGKADKAQTDATKGISDAASAQTKADSAYNKAEANETKNTEQDNRLTAIEEAGYQDAEDVADAIAEAIKGVTQFDYEVVEELPSTGKKGTVYLVKYAEGTEGDVYQEFIWIEKDKKFETLGFTNEIDLSGYVKKEDIDTISNSEIDALFSEAAE